MVAGDKHPVQIILNRDSQSNPNRASEVATQLINNSKVDIVDRLVALRPANPVADGAELADVPSHHLGRSVAGLVLRPQERSKKGFGLDLPLLLGLRPWLANMFADM